MVEEEGYEIEIICGIPSFCAVSARLSVPFALGNGPVMITTGEYKEFDGTLIIMKAGSKLKSIKEKILASGKKSWLVENCGMEDERVYTDILSMPDVAGYFSTLIVK